MHCTFFFNRFFFAEYVEKSDLTKVEVLQVRITYGVMWKGIGFVYKVTMTVISNRT